MRRIILIFIIFSFTLLSAEEYTNYSINAGVGGNLNQYFSDFSELPGVPNCCNNFDYTSSLGINLFLGAEVRTTAKLFGSPLTYGFNLNYVNLSANYIVEEFIGNYIEGNSVTQILVDNHLEADLSALLTEHTFSIAPFQNRNIALGLGFNVGFGLSNTFSQREELASPAGITFENGSRTRGEFSGDIPDASALHLSVFPKVRYTFWEKNSLSSFFETQYNFALSDVSSSVDWRADALIVRAGINYRLKKAKEPEIIPQDPPKNVIPMPEEPSVIPDTLLVDFKVYSNGSLTQNNDKLYYVINKVENINKIYAEPKFYFKSNSIEPLSSKSNQFTMQDLADLYSSNPNKNIILSESSVNEDDSIIANRKKQIVSEIGEISDNKVIFEDFALPTKVNNALGRHEGLADNYRFIAAKEYLPIIQKEERKVTSYGREPFMIRVQSNNYSNNTIKDEKITISMNGKEIRSIDGNYLEIDLSDYIDDSMQSEIDINISITDVKGNSKTESYSLALDVKDRIVETKYQVEGLSEIGANVLLIGLFDFDNSEFSYIEQENIKTIKQFISEGKKLTLVATTDSFGESDYNQNLASKRAKAALKLLNLNENDIEVIFEIDKYESEPSKKILEKCVFVKFN